jgi:hypothetical protein
MLCAVPPLRSSIKLDFSLDFWDSSVDSIRAANVGEELEEKGGEGEGDKLGVERRGCTGGGSRLWERIEPLELGSRF